MMPRSTQSRKRNRDEFEENENETVTLPSLKRTLPPKEERRINSM